MRPRHAPSLASSCRSADVRSLDGSARARAHGRLATKRSMRSARRRARWPRSEANRSADADAGRGARRRRCKPRKLCAHMWSWSKEARTPPQSRTSETCVYIRCSANAPLAHVGCRKKDALRIAPPDGKRLETCAKNTPKSINAEQLWFKIGPGAQNLAQIRPALAEFGGRCLPMSVEAHPGGPGVSCEQNAHGTPSETPKTSYLYLTGGVEIKRTASTRRRRGWSRSDFVSLDAPLDHTACVAIFQRIGPWGGPSALGTPKSAPSRRAPQAALIVARLRAKNGDVSVRRGHGPRWGRWGSGGASEGANSRFLTPCLRAPAPPPRARSGEPAWAATSVVEEGGQPEGRCRCRLSWACAGLAVWQRPLLA